MTYQDLLKLIQTKPNVVLAIDGPSGSGKSTFADQLQRDFGCTVFRIDDYFLPDSMKTEERLSEVGGLLDYERFQQEVLEHLHGNTIKSNHFNCKTQQLEQRDAVRRTNVVVVEGVYSMHPRFRPYYDYMVFLTVDSDVQINRILKRSNKEKLLRYQTEWIPRENSYFDTYSVKEAADVVHRFEEKKY